MQIQCLMWLYDIGQKHPRSCAVHCWLRKSVVVTRRRDYWCWRCQSNNRQQRQPLLHQLRPHYLLIQRLGWGKQESESWSRTWFWWWRDRFCRWCRCKPKPRWWWLIGSSTCCCRMSCCRKKARLCNKRRILRRMRVPQFRHVLYIRPMYNRCRSSCRRHTRHSGIWQCWKGKICVPLQQSQHWKSTK